MRGRRGRRGGYGSAQGGCTPRCFDERYRRLSRDGRVGGVVLARLWRGVRGSRRSRRPFGVALPAEHRHTRSVAAGARREAMTRKQQRLGVLALGLAALAGATALVLVAFNDNLVFFYSPSDLKARRVAADRRVRIGGLVEAQSLSRASDGRSVSFRLTDGSTDVAVVYQGLLPDLFREGQGAVAEGKLRSDGVFAAASVLAKHDENYMPREVVDALKKSGHWQEGGRMKDAAAAPDGMARSRGGPSETPAPRPWPP